MSNQITIKHGEAAPLDNQLQNYELGYANGTQDLYTKDKNNQIVNLTNRAQIENNKTEIENIKEQLENGGSGGGVIVSPTEPDEKDRGCLWVDTSLGGVSKYFDETAGSWKIVASTWG